MDEPMDASPMSHDTPSPLRPVDNPATHFVAGHTPPANRFLSPAPTLPSQWYRDERIHNHERRAIFSKSWILITHRSRFSKEGDYVQFEVGNFPFFVIRTKDGSLAAYHNVCRHRGFPIVGKGTGCAPLLACAYHGWCYSPSDGRLVKSTHTSFPSFDPSQYGLFKIHTRVIRSGFVFVNLSVEEPPPFEQWFGDLENEWNAFSPDEYEYAYSWTINGAYNWKTWMDGYQECVHCHTSHPGYANSLDLSTYAVETRQRYALHITSLKPETERPTSGSHDGPPSFVYVFPSNAVTVTTTMWYMMRVVPISATQTRMEYDVFKHKSITLDQLRTQMQFYEKVEDEDFQLVSATQKSLNTGIYRRGSLHPTKENGVIYYQRLVREAVEDHLAVERGMGYEWNPAQPVSQGGGRGAYRTQETDRVCSVRAKIPVGNWPLAHGDTWVAVCSR